MDYQRKKQLTQSVSYLQSVLVVGQDMIDSMKSKGLFTEEELTTVQKDDTASGKVIELVCLLKRKDNRTLTKFLEVLDDLGYDEPANVLKSNNNYAESRLPDPRTMNFLENFLSGIAIPHKTVTDLATVLIPKEIFRDEMDEMREKIHVLEKQLTENVYTLKREGTQTSMSNASHGSGEEITSPSDQPKAAFFGNNITTPRWDIPTKQEDMELLLRQKDEIIKRKDEEYGKLRRILDDSQKDLQSVLDLNSQYLDIISRLNQMQGVGAAPKNIDDKSTELMELEGKLDESRARIEQLRRDLIVQDDDLHLKQIELDKALKREKKIKDQLGLDDDADETVVQSTIRRLMEEGKLQRDDLHKISKELKRAMENRHRLEDQVTSLTRDKEKIEFHMRQQDLAIKKFLRIRVAADAVKKAEQTLHNGSPDRVAAQLLKLPAIEQSGTTLGLSNRTRAIQQQYCVFCRQEFQPLKGLTCRVHFRPIRRGKWSCCEDECHRSAGCLQLPHFYIEITADRKIFITDGARYMELT